ncbi:MAG: hypothetical protein HY791_25995 [Deltaproteobacteria bacterium]|nr:hypothetical protein [Deltaproteobacteria bacterium]
MACSQKVGAVDKRVAPFACLAFALAGACGEATRFLELPTPKGTPSAMLLIYESGATLDLSLHPWPIERTLSSPIDRLSRATLIFLDESPRELGLEEGALQVATPGECAIIPLPEGQARYTADFGRGETTFVEVASLPAKIEALRLSFPCPCRDFEALPLALPASETVEAAVRLAPDVALLFANDAMHFVDANGELRESRPAPVTQPRSSFRQDDGVVWVAGQDGALVRLDSEAVPHEVSSNTGAGVVEWLDGSTGAAPFELLLMSTAGVLERYSSAREILFDQAPTGSTSNLGGVAWEGPGRAVAMQPDSEDLLHVDHGTIEREKWAVQRGGVLSIRHAPEYGTVIVTRLSLVFHDDGTGWSELVQAAPAAKIRNVVPFEGGLFFVGDSGLIVQHHPAAGFCRASKLDPEIQLEQVAVLAGGAVVVAGRLEDEAPGPNRAFLLRAR